MVSVYLYIMQMNNLEYFLYKSRKSILEAQREFGIQYVLNSENSLTQCNSCGVWLKKQQMFPDLDALDICKECLDAYGP